MTVTEIMKRYHHTEELQFQSHPRLLFEGKVYPWIKPSLHMKSVPKAVRGCSYSFGIQAKEKSPTPECPEYLEAANEGILLHSKLGKEIQPDFNGEEETNKRSLLREALKESKKKAVGVTELYLPGYHNGLYLGGEPDYLVLKDNKVVELEEWKFSFQPKVTQDYEIQALTYCYFLHKLLDCIGFTYTIRVWDRKKVDKRKLKDWYYYNVQHEEVPLTVKVGHFTDGLRKVAEGYLTRTADLFNAKIPCSAYTEDNCPTYCKEGKSGLCPYWSWQH